MHGQQNFKNGDNKIFFKAFTKSSSNASNRVESFSNYLQGIEIYCTRKNCKIPCHIRKILPLAAVLYQRHSPQVRSSMPLRIIFLLAS